MYGDRIENLIQLLDKINAMGLTTNKSMMSYRLQTPDHIDESPVPVDASAELARLKSYQKQLQIEIDHKISVIERVNYVGSNEMHNSIGSPFVEIYRLNDIMKQAITFGDSTNPFPYVGNKTSYQLYINYVVHYAADAKHAVMNPLISDYFERGYRYLEGDKRAIIYENK